MLGPYVDTCRWCSSHWGRWNPLSLAPTQVRSEPNMASLELWVPFKDIEACCSGHVLSLKPRFSFCSERVETVQHSPNSAEADAVAQTQNQDFFQDIIRPFSTIGSCFILPIYVKVMFNCKRRITVKSNSSLCIQEDIAKPWLLLLVLHTAVKIVPVNWNVNKSKSNS